MVSREKSHGKKQKTNPGGKEKPIKSGWCKK